MKGDSEEMKLKQRLGAAAARMVFAKDREAKKDWYSTEDLKAKDIETEKDFDRAVWKLHQWLRTEMPIDEFKLLITTLIKNKSLVKENSGYSHGYIAPVPPKDPIDEYKDPQTRIKAIKSRPDDALKLIYAWVQQGTIDYREFVGLLADVNSLRRGYISDREPRWNQSSGLRGQP